MISALDEIDSVVRCIEAGAEDYLPKPFDPVLLRARINGCLERKRLRDREKVYHRSSFAAKRRSRRPCSSTSCRSRSWPASSAARRSSPTAFPTPPSCLRTSSASPSCRLVCSATRLVELLNLLFTDFDRLSVQFGLEKIKTIGDAYMVAGGLLEGGATMPATMPPPQRIWASRCWSPRARRAGTSTSRCRSASAIHTGPVVAGIIGTHKFIYDIWGDTVNTASRMESHGAVGTLNVSAGIRQRLGNTYLIEPGGRVDLKGKGPTDVYHLRGRR